MMRYAAALFLCLGLLQLQRLASPAGQVPATTAPDAQREAAYRANNVGVAHLEQFDYNAAEQSFREALKIQPELALARLNLAIALFYAGRPGEALVAAREAAKRLPDAPQAHYVLGLAARGEDSLDDAVAAFGRVLEIDAADAGSKIQLGQIHLQQRRYDDALKLFQEALASEPYNVTAAYSIALALTRAGKADDGRAAMQRFETLRDSPYGFTYAQAYLSQGRYAEAVASTGAEPELVDTAIPDVTFSDATGIMLPKAGPTKGNSGSVTLFDADGDGDLDVLEADTAGRRFLRNHDGVFSDETVRAGLSVAPDGESSTVAVAGDYDNDGRTDLFIVGSRAYHLFRQKVDGTFENVNSKAALPAPSADAVGAAAAADVDHDGDLDLLIGGKPAQLLRNNGDGTFTEIASAAGLATSGPAAAIAATDYDNRRDIDFLVMTAGGPVLHRNMRDGSFRDATSEAGLAAQGSFDRALAAGDVNKDGYIDFFFSRSDADGVFALSDGQTRFRTSSAPEGSRGARSAKFVDYDNDGLLDLMTVHPRGVRLFRHAGGQWIDATARTRLPIVDADESRGGIDALALGDLDNDGDTDCVLRFDGALRFLRNDGGNRNASLRVRLVARVSNRSGIGAKVEMRAGSLRQMLETSSSSPAIAPADIIFGLGARQAADVTRVLWPSGILQAETSFAAAAGPSSAPSPQSPSPAPRTAPDPKSQVPSPRSITITELDRKPSSCPYLFTWNGTNFEFVTDFMGGGEMGAWLAPAVSQSSGHAVWNQPDPDEYVRIRGDQLEPLSGRYELRLTNELEEAVFFDRIQLVAVDHPAGVEVFPNEGLRSPPRPPFRLNPTSVARPPARALDEHGHDVLPQLTSLDRRYPDDFRLLRIRGYAEPHELILDLGAASDNAILLLTGWTDYAFSNDNVAASQGHIAMSPPSLQVRDGSGAWRTVIDEIGFPVGRPQTVPVSLSGKFLSSSREVRILTNMRIYWDQILVSEPAAFSSVRVTRIDPATADLRWRGLSAETTPDGREPFAYDYHRVSTSSLWKVMVGRYTREGDVRSLLRDVDDLFVISQPGDELALSFPALPPAAPGLQRTFLLYAHGYSKEMNPRSAIPDTVAPLPFRAMTGYPYGPGEHYPRTNRHREYQERYNTRIVTRSLPSIDAPREITK